MAAADSANFENLTFVFAKTMPEIQHEYVKRTPENEKDFLALFDIIQKHGRYGTFRGTRYRYWYRGDGYKYWTMTTDLKHPWARIINRAKEDTQ
jgi:hypothetical protein